jgi:hypothetical protein
MPVQSEKQRRFMYASLAGKTDVPPSVAKKFVGPSAHKAEGGTVKESKEMMKKEVAFMKKKGAPKSMLKHEMKEAKGYARGGGVESKGKTKGKMVKMMKGGSCG